ncbi:hypothetical protein GALMADRAFT_257638 [Galerina marginata CBS 339.88]|uniref:Uncharacterized protein n=1 Tax=Galerina marginata (strain CBS 339.88) TaxID=685588 RepID=A0A067SAB2_GALM3|nr:hypothetical protein GALMADRAFT_257638 [Galerina marginata CBS 339.88]
MAALKILVADASQTSKLDALCYLERARNVDKDSGGEFVLELFDFQIEGPNGTHQCVVSELLGTGVHGHPQIPVPLAKSMSV